MTNSVTCEDVRGQLFEFYRGELSDLRRSAVDEHLEQCRECRELAAKTSDMLDASRADSETFVDVEPDSLFERIEERIAEEALEAADETRRLDDLFDAARSAGDDSSTDIDSDALFERIAGRIGEAPADELGAEVVDLGDANGEDDTGASDVGRSTGSGWKRWAVAAAAVCAVFVVWLALASQDRSTGPVDTVQTAENSPSTDDEVGESTEAVEQPESMPSSAETIASMEPVEVESESVRLFANRDTDYEFAERDDSYEVELSDGGMVVEYLPRSNVELSVRVRSQTIRVVGTVFSVEAGDDGIRIAVFEGAVRVSGPDGSTRRIGTGEFVVGEQRGAIDMASFSALERHVDLEAHRRVLLQTRRAAARQTNRQVTRAVQTARSRADQRFASNTESPEETSAAEPQRPEPDRGERPDPDSDTGDPPGADESDSGAGETSSQRGEEPGEEQPRADLEGEEAESDENARPEGIEMDRSATGEPIEDDSAEDSPQVLRRQALEAVRREEHRRAVELLERALEQTAPTDRTSADILLELARIHLRELDEPQRAVSYLEQFVDQWPNDPAADAIRDQLCDLDAVDSDDEEICE